MNSRVASQLLPFVSACVWRVPMVMAVLGHPSLTNAEAINDGGSLAEQGHYTRSVVVLAGDDGSELQIDTCLQEDLAILLGDDTSRTRFPSAVRGAERPAVPVLVVPIDVGGGVDAGCYGDDCDMTCDEYPGPTVRVHKALQVRCDGFHPPMDAFPVRSSGIGAYPLMMRLFGPEGFEVTDLDVSAPPVVQVVFRPGRGGQAVDVSEQMVRAGRPSEGNQFAFTEMGLWQFNLKSQNYRAPGKYIVSAVSGDDSEYVLLPTCTTGFVAK